MNVMSNYMMFNPYQHLTEAFRMSTRQWDYVKAGLTETNLVNIENGASVRIGMAAKVWKAR